MAIEAVCVVESVHINKHCHFFRLIFCVVIERLDSANLIPLHICKQLKAIKVCVFFSFTWQNLAATASCLEELQPISSFSLLDKNCFYSSPCLVLGKSLSNVHPDVELNKIWRKSFANNGRCERAHFWRENERRGDTSNWRQILPLTTQHTTGTKWCYQIRHAFQL